MALTQVPASADSYNQRCFKPSGRWTVTIRISA
jgi:hypothetical protein